MDEAKKHLFKALEIKNNFSTADQTLSMLLDYGMLKVQNI